MARKNLMVACAATAVVSLALVQAASADPFVPSSLRQAALANPAQTFKVIVQGAPSVSSRGVAGDVQSQERSHPGREHGLRRSFRLLSGISADLTGRQIVALSSGRRILAITPDMPLNANDLGGPTNVVPPSVAGAAAPTATLSALNGEWAGGTAPYGDFAYQWRHCDAAGAACVDIADATGSEYVVTLDDVGSTLAVAVTATDANGLTATADSAASEPVAAPPPPQLVPPANLTAPVVSGLARAGETLSATAGSWQTAFPVTYAFQWQRCATACTDIPDATAETYDANAADAGFALRVAVTAQDAAGSATAVSAASDTVVPVEPAPAPTQLLPPANLSAPLVTGSAHEGETLSAAEGSWQGTDPMTYAFQ